MAKFGADTGLPFHKMHGLGNDFVVLDGRETGFPVTAPLARALFSNAGGWGMAFFGFAASPATPNIWLRLAANEEGSARAAVHDAWPKAQPCW